MTSRKKGFENIDVRVIVADVYTDTVVTSLDSPSSKVSTEEKATAS